MRIFKGNISVIFALICLLLSASNAFSDTKTICIKKTIKGSGKSTSKINIKHSAALKLVTGTTCAKGYVALFDSSSFKGDSGTNGTNGNNGTNGTNADELIYGDGSSGALTVSANNTLDFLSSNLNFTNVVVNPGVTLDVPSGTSIRCTGTFDNQGTVNITRYGAGGIQRTQSSGGLAWVSALPPAPSFFSGEIAGNALFGNNNAVILGGTGPSGMAAGFRNVRRALLPTAGGGGGGSSSNGGAGGGAGEIVCAGAITNSGTIKADGQNGTGSGAGGGGGGLIRIASATSIVNTGSISAKGGDGGSANATAGSGGAGGGGFIQLISPAMAQGSLTVVAGVSGTGGGAGTVTLPGFSGGAGGAGYGFGATGGSVATNGTAGGAGAAASGDTSLLVVDPSSYFLNG